MSGGRPKFTRIDQTSPEDRRLIDLAELERGPRNAGIDDAWHVTFDGQRVGMANAAGMNAQADLMPAGFGQVALFHTKLGTSARNDH